MARLDREPVPAKEVSREPRLPHPRNLCVPRLPQFHGSSLAPNPVPTAGLSEYLAAVLLLGDACACGALGKFLEATPARLQAESYSPRAQLLSATLRSDGSAVSFLLPEVPRPEGHPAASKAMTAKSWCEAVCCEVAWLNAEAEFPRAFSHSAELPTISEADPLLYPTSAALMRREYARFGLVEAPKSGEAGPEASGLWRLVDNSTYQICESYPSVFAVPASVRCFAGRVLGALISHSCVRVHSRFFSASPLIRFFILFFCHTQ